MELRDAITKMWREWDVQDHWTITDGEYELLETLLSLWLMAQQSANGEEMSWQEQHRWDEAHPPRRMEQPTAAWAPTLGKSSDAITAGIAQPVAPPTVNDWVTAASVTFPTAKLRPETRLSITDFQRVVAYMMEIGVMR
jgi:hypothetical protein